MYVWLRLVPSWVKQCLLAAPAKAWVCVHVWSPPSNVDLVLFVGSHSAARLPPYIHKYINKHTHTHTYIRTHTRAGHQPRTRISFYSLGPWLPPHIHKYIHTHTHILVYMYTYINAYIYIHTYLYMCTRAGHQPRTRISFYSLGHTLPHGCLRGAFTTLTRIRTSHSGGHSAKKNSKTRVKRWRSLKRANSPRWCCCLWFRRRAIRWFPLCVCEDMYVCIYIYIYVYIYIYLYIYIYIYIWWRGQTPYADAAVVGFRGGQ